MKQNNKNPQTLVECDEAIAQIESQFKTPHELRHYAEQHAADRRNWLKWKETTPGDRNRFTAELAEFEHDAALLPEWRRLMQLRPKIERAEKRAGRAGLIGDGAAGVNWPALPSFAARLQMPETLSGVPAEVYEQLAGIVAEVNKVVDSFTAEPAVNPGALGELGTAVTAKAVAALREARQTCLVVRANNCKRYILALRVALGKLVEFDPEEIARGICAEVQAKAEALAKQIEADAVKAGIDPAAAASGAFNAPKVCELLATLPTPGNSQALENKVEAMLLERAESARITLEQALEALA